MKKLFLLDAFALIYRAHFALIRNPMINSKGMNVSASFGFTNTLNDLMIREKPTHLGVVFDLPGGTARDDEYEFYKANRQEQPEDISIAIPIIKDLLAGFKIPVVEEQGYEADDLIGTLAKQAEKEGFQTYMVTPDKDFGQLVSDNIFMYKPSYMGKPSEILGVPEIREKWQIKDPLQVIDILGMMGDSVDNIPGIPGVGPKTAMKLIGQYDSLEGVLENVDELKGKLQEKVRDNAEQGLMSKRLATIILDAPIGFDEKDFLLEPPDKEVLAKLFAELEFRSLGKRILGSEFNVNVPPKPSQMDLFGQAVKPGKSAATGQSAAGSLADGSGQPSFADAGKHLGNTDHDYQLVSQQKERKALASELSKAKKIALTLQATGVTPNEAELAGISFATEKGKAWYIPLPNEPEKITEVLADFKTVLEDVKIPKLGHDLKYCIVALKNYGINLAGIGGDSMIAHYLIEPDKRHKLDFLSENFLGYTPIALETITGRGKNALRMRDVPLEKLADYGAESADVALQLNALFDENLQKFEANKLNESMELPLINVLAEMESTGVKIDKSFLGDYAVQMAKEIDEIKDNVYKEAGVEFNLDSPKQLGEILFDKMGIPYKGKKTKTGQFSTNEETLSKLAPSYKIIEELLTYRQINKLKSTYVDALPLLINAESGRVHTTYSQAVAATGRLSSNNPNLQNIPIRTERGREIRRAFIPRDKDHLIFSADYSQVELRLIASISGDKTMIKAFKDGVDIHSVTAANVYSVPLEEVTPEMRSRAKMVNFGISYGISAFGLAQRLGISRTEGKELIDNYFKTYDSVRKFMDDTIETAKEKGYVETLMGRRRYLPDLNSRNYTVRSHAERNAVNSPIQGSAADMIKVAMIDVQAAIKDMRSKMILQVHDELVFDAHKDELDELKSIVHEKMGAAMDLKVPLIVESGVGQNWLEAH